MVAPLFASEKTQNYPYGQQFPENIIADDLIAGIAIIRTGGCQYIYLELQE
jgi:hypothetical protein